VEQADVVLIVGTSLQVYPAASLYHYAGPGVPIFIIDPKEVPAYDKRITHIRDVATRGMKVFLEKLKEL
jgi:NAD-dependent deacetylase